MKVADEIRNGASAELVKTTERGAEAVPTASPNGLNSVTHAATGVLAFTSTETSPELVLATVRSGRASSLRSPTATARGAACAV